MTRATITNVNKAIEKHSVEMIKGGGYFYFMPLVETNEILAASIPEIDSVYTVFIRDLTLEEWAEHVGGFFR